MAKLKEKIYKIYNKHIYRNFRHLRGITRLRSIFLRLAVEQTNEEPESIYDKGEWDNLIILDACRYDIYKEVTGRDAEKRISLGSTSSEFFARTFDQGDFSDTVYVSANGFAADSQLKEHAGRKNIFHEKFMTISTDWNEKVSVPLPESVARDARTAEKLFKDKKKIIHFLQPHDPFIEYGLNKEVEKHEQAGNEHELAKRNEITDEQLVEGYKNNLVLVLEVVEELIKDLDGKTIVTADHGELLGEGGAYRHPGKNKARKLREVPWDVIENKENPGLIDDKYRNLK